MSNENSPHLFADFNNVARDGRVRLNTKGTSDDLRNLGIELCDGLNVVLSDGEEFVADGVVHLSKTDGWVAEIDWTALRPLCSGERAG